MKTMLLAAFAVLVLSTGAAAAQGRGATATAKTYGQQWAEIHWAKCQHTTADRGSVGTSAPTSYIGGGGIHSWGLFDRLTRARAGGG